MNNFLLILNSILAFKNLKKKVLKKSNVKDLKKMKTIISLQIIKNFIIKIFKVSLLLYLKYLLKEKNLIHHNISFISLKVGLFIKINRLNNNNKANFRID